MKARSQKDFLSGLMFTAVGIAFAVGATNFDIGGAARMGPGYFPTILGGLLATIGAVAVVRSLLTQGEGISRFTLKGLGLVLGSTLLFGLLVRGAGLPVAIIVMVLMSGLASIKFKLVPFAIVAIGMAIFCGLVFVKGLGLPMPLIGNWFGI